MGKIIGIDLGSTYSVVSVFEGNKPTAIANEEGKYSTASVIALKNGERKIGDSAKRQIVVNPKETVNIIKRFMGATYEESAKSRDHVQYDVVNRDGMPRVLIEGGEYSPEELSAMIIQKMKKIAEDYLGEEVTDAVITVPAFFNDSARSATKTAGELAGLNVKRIIAEPTAAILAANIDMSKEGKYLVVDCGGATTDNSVADIGGDVVEILANDGDLYLGGSDFDKALADYVVATFRDKEGIDLSTNADAMTRVYDACEKAKIELSSSVSTEINLPFICVKEGTTMVHLEQTITRAKFEQIISPFVDTLIEKAKNALASADVKASELDGIVLVGGSCRIPLIQTRLTDEFGVKLIKSANLDLAVSEGACIQGAILNNETDNSLVLIDVTPLAYGIETMGSVMTTLVEANSTIPCKKSEIFSTAMDNQTSVDIRVLQGNRPMAKDNKEVGIFRLDGIMPARRGVPQIEVTFDINANGILTVSAIDKGTGKEQHITIQSKNSLSQEEIEKMKADAERFAESDKKAREEADTINKGDGIVFTQEKMLEEMGDKMSDDEKSNINELVETMRTHVKEKNVEGINNTEKAINEAWNKISERIYSAQQSAPTSDPTPQTDTNGSGEEVQDASFEEVK